MSWDLQSLWPDERTVNSLMQNVHQAVGKNSVVLKGGAALLHLRHPFFEALHAGVHDADLQLHSYDETPLIESQDALTNAVSRSIKGEHVRRLAQANGCELDVRRPIAGNGADWVCGDMRIWYAVFQNSKGHTVYLLRFGYCFGLMGHAERMKVSVVDISQCNEDVHPHPSDKPSTYVSHPLSLLEEINRILFEETEWSPWAIGAKQPKYWHRALWIIAWFWPRGQEEVLKEGHVWLHQAFESRRVKSPLNPAPSHPCPISSPPPTPDRPCPIPPMPTPQDSSEDQRTHPAIKKFLDNIDKMVRQQLASDGSSPQASALYSESVELLLMHHEELENPAYFRYVGGGTQ